MADRSYLDWPFFDVRHRELARDLDSWCDAGLAGLCENDTDAACRELVARLGNGGWLRHCVPASHGGASESIDVRAISIIRETLARHDGLADFAFAMQGLGSGTISLFGSDVQKQKYLPAVARGEKIAAFALTEPETGSDIANLGLAAEWNGDGFTLSGTKTYISNGGIADFYVTFARTGEGDGARGISAFIVDADAPGLDASERIDVIAPHPLATVRYDQVKLGEDALLGTRGEGFKHAMATLDVFRISVAAAALGFARRALDEATRYTTARKLGAGTLADNAVTQASLAEMVRDIDSAALLVYRAGWLRDIQGERATREAAIAKLDATESAQRIIDAAVQLHGGLGVTVGCPVERLYRDIRALRIYEGASEVQRMIIARYWLKEQCG